MPHPNLLRLQQLYAAKPVVLAPLEDVSDVVFRRICRGLGAEITVTEFVNVEGLLRGCRNARRKIRLAEDDVLTAIQIYGADPDRLAEAARYAEQAEPLFIDINCGCWVPKIAGRGAGAGWLRDPTAMVAMAKMVVSSVSLPVTVKTRIGLGPESHMPIVDLARRLEDTGVAAITVHCRTANMGHSGAADWTWAMRAREVVSIPVLVNGDVRSGEDARRAIESTGCAGVMIGRRAIEHPWIFREVRARLDRGATHAPPTTAERLACCRDHLLALREIKHEHAALRAAKRYYGGYLKGLVGAKILARQLGESRSIAEALEHLANAEVDLAA